MCVSFCLFGVCESNIFASFPLETRFKLRDCLLNNLMINPFIVTTQVTAVVGWEVLIVKHNEYFTSHEKWTFGN